MSCPKCGFDPGSAPECPRCGVVFAKLRRAASSADAPELTDAKGIVRTSAAQASPARGTPHVRLGLHRRASLAHSLATFHRAGISITEALATLITSERSGSLRGALERTRDALHGGATLVGAITASGLGASFDAVGLALLRAGETSGQIAEAFDAIGAAAQRDLAIRREVTHALLYPIVLLILGCFLLPLRVLIFEGVGAYLRAALLPLVVGGGVFVCGSLFVRLLRRHAPRALAVFERVPLLATAARRLAHARAAATLASLLDAGLPVALSLAAAGDASGSASIRLLFARVAAEVAGGETLATGFARAGALPGLQMIIVTGEKGGTLPDSLRVFAKSEQEAGEYALRILVRALTATFILGVFAYLGWRSFAQVMDVRESLEKLLDVDPNQLAPGITEGMRELQRELEQ